MSAASSIAALEYSLQGTSFLGWDAEDVIKFLRRQVQEILERLDITQLDEPTRVAIRDGIKRLYDQYVRPFDIPLIPNLIIEPMVDDKIWDMICIQLDVLLNLDHNH